MDTFIQNIKNFFANKKMRKIIILSLVGFLVFLFLLIFIINKLTYKITYTALEDQLISATSNYLKDHPEYYPTKEVPLFTLSDSALVEGKYMKKAISKLVKDTCSAEINVEYKNGAYSIIPMLSCSKYETKLFYDKVLYDNPVTTDGNGLYDMNEMLVFRGDTPHNYVTFHNMLWRIVKMDPVDSKVYLMQETLKDTDMVVWDNRYNTTEESKHGINDYTVSSILGTLENTYLPKFTENERVVMLPMDICIGKRSEEETTNNGMIECSNIMTEQKYISLLPMYDYMNASTDYQCRSTVDRACSNYNYMVNKAGKWWTLTADGSRGTRVFGVNYTGVVSSDYADSKKYARLVIAIDGTGLYRSGNGTAENPYVLKH